MDQITRVGVDLAKLVIQVHAITAAGRVMAAKAMSTAKFAAWCAQLPPGCIVAMESCSGAHHWARTLRAMGLDVRLVAGHFVAPYRMQGKGGKNDANDAAAICEAAGRPHMRFVPIKTAARFGSWLGLVPSQNSSGGKARLGGITKRGDDYLRTLLVQGAKSAVMTAHKRSDRISQWLVQLTARVGWQKAVVALANKNARILWAVLAKGRSFDPDHVPVKPQVPAMVVPTMAG